MDINFRICAVEASTHIVSPWALGALSVGFCVPLTYPHLCMCVCACVCVNIFSFLVLENA